MCANVRVWGDGRGEMSGTRDEDIDHIVSCEARLCGGVGWDFKGNEATDGF